MTYLTVITSNMFAPSTLITESLDQNEHRTNLKPQARKRMCSRIPVVSMKTHARPGFSLDSGVVYRLIMIKTPFMRVISLQKPMVQIRQRTIAVLVSKCQFFPLKTFPSFLR